MMAADSLYKEIEVFAITHSKAEAAKRPPPDPIEAPPAPRMPDVTRLSASIMSSKDKLFFIEHKILGSDQSEWALVRIDLQLSIIVLPLRVCRMDVFLCNFISAILQTRNTTPKPALFVELSTQV